MPSSTAPRWRGSTQARDTFLRASLVSLEEVAEDHGIDITEFDAQFEPALQQRQFIGLRINGFNLNGVDPICRRIVQGLVMLIAVVVASYTRQHRA